MRILITGGAGFIGSSVCRHIIQATNHEILNIDALTYAGNLKSLSEIEDNPNYAFKRVDIRDRANVHNVISEFQPEAIFHLAAETHVDRSIASAGVFIETNVLGTFNLLEVSKRYWEQLPTKRRDAFRFIHISTDEVYGSLGTHGLFSEHSPYDPSSPYSASKAASDHLVQAWFRTHGLPAIITNCSNCYGPYQYPEKLIALMILNASEGLELPVYGDGSNIRDWLYVDDHARALMTVLERGKVGEKYNIGGRNEQTNLQVVERICDILDQISPSAQPRNSLIRMVDDRLGHDKRYAIDATKLENELGWTAQETFETGLRKTIDWYLLRKDWWEPLREAQNGNIDSGSIHSFIKTH